MIEFRQLILPGDAGSDVLAVKHTMRAMGIQGSSAMTMNANAGPAFVKTLQAAQMQAGITVDGKYGKQSHRLIAPNFSPEDEELYRTSLIRIHEAPHSPNGDAAANAARLLRLRAEGKYRADNPGDLTDIQATAEGRAVHSPSGKLVHIDGRVMGVLVHLIESGHKIGTFAICSDHRFDSSNGHAGGKAVDVSSIDGQSITLASARPLVIKIDNELHNAGALTPRQLISGGVGNARDPEISRLSIPGADSFYGAATMLEHCNHIHVGY
jgi:hypothetical protein